MASTRNRAQLTDQVFRDHQIVTVWVVETAMGWSVAGRTKTGNVLALAHYKQRRAALVYANKARHIIDRVTKQHATPQ